MKLENDTVSWIYISSNKYTNRMKIDSLITSSAT